MNRVFLFSLILSSLINCFNTVAQVKDASNNLYSTVTIKNQEWIIENLQTDKFRNGDLIKQAKTKEEWIEAGKNNLPSWCYYNFDEKIGIKQGKLYNWFAVNDPRGLTPPGYKVPNDSDWMLLVENLGGNEIAGLKMKSETDWGNNGQGNNESKFNAIPSGYIFNNGESFLGNTATYWWSNTAKDEKLSWSIGVTSEIKGIHRFHIENIQGLSIRAVKE